MGDAGFASKSEIGDHICCWFLRFISIKNMIKLKKIGVQSGTLDVLFPKFKIKMDTGMLSVLREMGTNNVFTHPARLLQK